MFALYIEVIKLFIENFSRHEYKFPMTYDNMDRLLDDLLPYIEQDEHADENGYYTISSIYLDNDTWQCFYETINKDRYRQKVRLRVYGEVNNDSVSFFEIKSKFKGLVLKRRVKMRLGDAMRFMEACVNGEDPNVDEYECSNRQILKELKQVIVSKNLKPVVVVSYERLALFYKEDPRLRITFDVNIRTRDYDIDLTKGSHGDYVTADNVAILEVKSDRNVPFWLVRILSKYGYRNQTFSKYCSHFIKYSEEEQIEEYDELDNDAV